MNRILCCLAGLLAMAPLRAWAWSLESELQGADVLVHWSMDESPQTVTMQQADWLQLDLEGAGSLMAPGAPQLPFVSRMIELDAGQSLAWELVDARWEAVDGKPLPQQAKVRQPEEFPPSWEFDATAYSAAGSRGSELVMLGDPVIVRGQSWQQLGLVPARYNAEREQLELLREATLRVQRVADSSAPQALRPDAAPLDGLVPGEQLVALEEAGALREMQSSLPGSYLVLARNSVTQNNAFLQLWLNWKRDKGHEIVIAGESQVGGWTTSAIDQYIASAYTNWSSPPAYVLLVGDPSASGDYYLPTGSTGEFGTYDHDYACVDGADLYADLVLGRLSVSTGTQLSTVCNKILGYETDPTFMGTDWLETAALNTGYFAYSMIQQSRTIAGDMVEQGITQVDTLWYTGSYNPSWVNSAFNNGICLYNFRGYIGMAGISESYIQDDANFTNSFMTPVAAIFTCATGDFNQTACESESFLLKGSIAEPRGAVAAMGFATAGTETKYNNALVGGFWNSFLDRNVPQVGTCMFAGKAFLLSTLPPGDQEGPKFARWANLMGDPGMDMWCGVPEQLEVSLVGGSTIPLGSELVEAQVLAGGQPVANAVVCLRQGSTYTTVALTDAAGHALLALDGAAAGSLALTASKPDFIPDRESATISDTAFLVLQNWNAAGDGLVSPGETVSLNPVLLNDAGQYLPTISASLEALDAGVTVIDALGGWSTVSSGQQEAADNAFTISVPGSLTDLHVLHFRINYSSAAGGFSDVVALELHQPVFQLSGLEFTPGGQVLDPGDTAALLLSLQNQGAMAASSFQFTLSAGSDPFLSVLNANATGSVLPGGSVQLAFQVAASPVSIRGHVVPLEVAWSGSGMSGVLTSSAVIGVASSAGPTGPDAHGYVAIEDTDSNTQAPVFDWVGIAPAEGGSGINLNLTDYADEDDDAAHVNLPFDVVYYGVSYSEMFVCSNGFVSFDPAASGQTDFRNHIMPSALGPDAMIAANWDDHMIGSGGGVYWLHDAANHRVIVEWHQMVHNNSGGQNTFQLILLDPAYYSTPTGDSPFVMQYLDWDNTQEHSYDFPGCTVGIKNETSSIGLNLTNYQINDPTVTGFGDGKAILFTTAQGEHTEEPVIAVSQVGMAIIDVPVSISATILDDTGIGLALLYWRVQGGSWSSTPMSSPGNDVYTGTIPAQPSAVTLEYYVHAEDLNDPAYVSDSPVYSCQVLAGNPPTGPESYGYRIYDSADVDESHPFQWIDISGMGVQLSLGDDATATVNLPFTAVYYGASYSQLSVCSNGFAVFGSSSYTAYSNASIESGGGTPNMVCAFWDDLNPNSGGQVRAADLGDGRFVVSWIDVPHFSSGGPERFQLVIHDPAVYPTVTGDSPMLIQYASLSNATSCTVGIRGPQTGQVLQYVYNTSYGSNADPLVDGQTLWITTGMVPLLPVTDLSIAIQGGSALLSWTSTDAPAYHVYSGPQAYGAVQDFVTGTTSTSVLLPLVEDQLVYQVRSASAVSRVTRQTWVPQVQLHPAHDKQTAGGAE